MIVLANFRSLESGLLYSLLLLLSVIFRVVGDESNIAALWDPMVDICGLSSVSFKLRSEARLNSLIRDYCQPCYSLSLAWASTLLWLPTPLRQEMTSLLRLLTMPRVALLIQSMAFM